MKEMNPSEKSVSMASESNKTPQLKRHVMTKETMMTFESMIRNTSAFQTHTDDDFSNIEDLFLDEENKLTIQNSR